jgi:hypothetical protein
LKDPTVSIRCYEGIVAKSCLVAKESSVAAILNYSAETNEVYKTPTN